MKRICIQASLLMTLLVCAIALAACGSAGAAGQAAPPHAAEGSPQKIPWESLPSLGHLLGERDQGRLSETATIQMENRTGKKPDTPALSKEPTQPPTEETDDEEWNLRLINQEHLLPEDFTVPELTQLRKNHAIDSRVYPALQKMLDDARAAGYRPLICSSFRTWEKQSELFERKVRYYEDQGLSREEAEASAAVWVARPGTSEHQAGLAVDIVSVEYQVLDEKQADTPLQQWLMEHCWEYGFILRYPTEKSELTGVGFEPWHYRYVGLDAAQAITEQGLCLEEYLELE